MEDWGPSMCRAAVGREGADGPLLFLTSNYPACNCHEATHPAPHWSLGPPSCPPHFSDTNRILWTPPPPPIKALWWLPVGRWWRLGAELRGSLGCGRPRQP